MIIIIDTEKILIAEIDQDVMRNTADEKQETREPGDG